MQKCNYSFDGVSWDQILDFAVLHFGGKQLGARVQKLAMAASIYCVWQERNQIIYQQRIKSAMKVSKDVEANVRTKALYWKVKIGWCVRVGD